MFSKEESDYLPQIFKKLKQMWNSGWGGGVHVLSACV